MVLCTVTMTGVPRPASLAAHSATHVGVAHRRDQRPRALAAEVADQRHEAADQTPGPEIHDPHLGRQVVQEHAVRHGEHHVHRLAPLDDTLDQIDDHPLGAAAPDRGKEEGDAASAHEAPPGAKRRRSAGRSPSSIFQA